MAGRTLLPILTIGALGVATASIGLGYGLAKYTVSGIDPFYAAARSTDWQVKHSDTPATDTARTDDVFAAVSEPATTR